MKILDPHFSPIFVHLYLSIAYDKKYRFYTLTITSQYDGSNIENKSTTSQCREKEGIKENNQKSSEPQLITADKLPLPLCIAFIIYISPLTILLLSAFTIKKQFVGIIK